MDQIAFHAFRAVGWEKRFTIVVLISKSPVLFMRRWLLMLIMLLLLLLPLFSAILYL